MTIARHRFVDRTGRDRWDAPGMQVPCCSMRLLTRPRTCTHLALLILTGALVAASSLEAAPQRLMVLESIHVGKGEVLEQATCIACSIHVEGVVDGGALVLLGRLQNDGEIKGDAVVLGGSAMSAGPIGGSAFVVGGTLHLEGNVDENAVTVMGDLEITASDVKIGANAWTVLGQQRGLETVSVAGNTRRFGTTTIGRMLVSGLVGVLLLVALLSLAAALALNFFGYMLLGVERLAVMADACTRNPASCFLLGLGTCFGLSVVGLTLSMLLPVSLPVLGLFLVVSAIGFCGLAFAVGRNLLPRSRPLLATMFGGLLLGAIELIPLVGWLVLVVLWNVAIGTAIMSGFGSSANWLGSRTAGQLAR